MGVSEGFIHSFNGMHLIDMCSICDLDFNAYLANDVM